MAQHVQTAACPAQAALFPALFQQALDRPELAFACAAALRHEAQRDRVLRQAYSAAMVKDREVVRRNVAAVIDRPWVGDVNFFDALQLAPLLSEADGGKLLVAAARKNPSLAVREVPSYWSLPYGGRVFETAALRVPAELVVLARGNSPTGAALRIAMAAGRLPSMKVLVRLAGDDRIDDFARQRLAVLHEELASGRLSEQNALPIVRRDSAYFVYLADLRLRSSGAQAEWLDRAMTSFAQMAFLEARSRREALERLEPKQLPARGAYFLLSYGRTESDDPTFAFLFDQLLAPKLGGGGLARLIEETRGLHLRRFLSTTVRHGRFEAFLRAAGDETTQANLLKRAMRAIEQEERPLDAAVAAAEVLDALGSERRMGAAGEVLEAEYGRLEKAGSPVAGLYGLLAARLAERIAPVADSGLGRIGSRYAAYWQAPGTLDAMALFSGGLCVQRHYFYDDQDGVESYASFLETYRRDPAWVIETKDGWVRLSSGGNGRRVEILANEPLDLNLPRNQGKQEEALRRQAAVARELSARGLRPTVVVHRGHAFHTEKTVRELTDAARLVFLGSCKGIEEVDAVMASSNVAQMIATRAVGTQNINDPLLKAINDQLLNGVRRIEWEPFWREQEKRLGRTAVFLDYIPPHRNSAAILLAAYYRYLSGS